MGVGTSVPDIVLDPVLLGDFDEVSRREWIETNGAGGWASSTGSGAHTRRYHGLLVAATRPPAGRMVLLSKLVDAVVVGGNRFKLDCNRSPNAVHPRGFTHLRSFAKGLFPVFEFQAGGVTLRKTTSPGPLRSPWTSSWSVGGTTCAPSSPATTGSPTGAGTR